MECLIAGMVAVKHNIPFVMTIQKSPVPDEGQLKQSNWTAVQFCYRHIPCVGVIATSEVYARQARQLGAQEPIKRIYYGIDLRQFRLDPRARDQMRQELGVAPATTVVLCPSRIDDRKGIDVLIKATKNVIEAVPDLRVIVAGRRGPEVERWYQFLAGLVRGYGLEGIVSLGAKENAFDQMARLYSAADICTLPSLREGLGLSVIEAMSTGVPVIATNTVGIDELIVDGENGVMVPVNDPEALANAIVRLARDPDLRRSFSERAISFAKTKGFDYETMAREHISFYSSLLQQD
jgi:glycosyltransferase involved in cell wall biosynthesis